VLCRHFGICGGCATQDVPYAEEILRKEAALRERLGRAVEVVPSPRELRYRTRMDYVFAWGKLGMRKRGDPRGVVDLEECLLVSPGAWEAVARAKAAAKRLELEPYTYLAKRGYLRYIIVREAPVAGERMLIFLTNGRDPAVRPLLEEAEAWADSVVWASTEQRADVSNGEVVETRGRGWLEERVGALRLRFGPNSFFQANPWQTERLCAHVAERVRGRAIDLFCGVGGFALAAAPRADAMLGVDASAEAIGFARTNAERNGIAARFEAVDAAEFLRSADCDTMIVDPPRAGLGGKVIRRLVRAAPARILYVSCNPKVLAGEMPQFLGYETTELRGFDLFPRTPHVEVVATLERVATSASPT
jgi:tRNA/tmRNA/rRNA uracil-C5-methylase (TrmA/RlmC/RlmD family)